MPALQEQAGVEFQALVEIMRRLRGPGGCPWDREQTFASLRSYLLEESYEVLDALDRRDLEHLAEELGDLLLQPVFLAELASESGAFTITDCLQAINEKLVRRHPHIFEGAVAETAQDVKVRWDEIKREEKARKGRAAGEDSRLSGVLRNVPALVEALEISKKAAAAGFDWPDVDGALQKLEEEAREVVEARDGRSQAELEHEIGDLLFSVVNVARFLKIDAEQALRSANLRFRGRFGHIERRVEEQGLTLEELPLDQLEELWQEAKRTPGHSDSASR